VAAALCAAELTRDASAAVPAELTRQTITAALTGTASASVAALIAGGMGGVMGTKVQQVTALALVTLALAAGTAALGGLGQPPDPPAPADKVPPPPAAAARPALNTTPACLATISGTATGPDGKPVASATVYLTYLWSLTRPLATTTTDGQGRYAFQELPVPVRGDARTQEGQPLLPLQVCGIAPGLAFTWHKEQYAPMHPLPAEPDRPGGVRYKADPQTADLTFDPPAHLQGRFVDDRGRPVAGATVRLSGCASLRAGPQDDMFWATRAPVFPENRTTAVTGRDGRFRLDGLPQDVIALLKVTHPDYPTMDLYAADSPLPEERSGLLTVARFMGSPQARADDVWIGDINLTLATLRAFPVRVLSKTSGQPVAGALVSMSNQGKVLLTSAQHTDAQGRATLRMPPGNYTLAVRAPGGVPEQARDADKTVYAKFQESVDVAADTAGQPHAIRLEPCCAVLAQVVDANTGRPVADAMLFVSVEREADGPGPNVARPSGRPGRGDRPGRGPGRGTHRWQRVEESRGYAETPHTDAQGRATIWAAPGRGRIRVQATGYEESITAEPIELPAGKEIKLRVELRATGQPAPKPAAPPPAPAAKPPTVPVTVTGTATGPDGKPVAGATIYLMAENGQLDKPLASTSTDGQGRYEFRDVPVPLLNPSAQSEGLCLSVFGTAPGLAFTWHPRTYPVARRSAPVAGPPQDARYTTDPQIMDLTFDRPARLEGQIVDEHRQPVAGAQVHIWFCDRLPVKRTIDAASWAVGAAPQRVNTATTGSDGRFRLDGLPPDLIATLRIRDPRYTDVYLYAATAEPPLPGVSDYASAPHPGPENPVWTGPIDVVLAAPQTTPVKVVSGATGQPLQGCFVGLRNTGKVRSSVSGTTDAQGNVSLRMPPGEHTLLVRPPRGADYIQSEERITIPTASPIPGRTVQLESGCIVRIEAVDAETKRPVPQVFFRQRGETQSGDWPTLESETGYSDSPYRTNAQGQLRVVVRPGRRQIKVGSPEYEAISGPTEPVELPAGKEVTLRVELRATGQPAAKPAAPPPAPAAKPPTVPVTVTGAAIGPDNQPVTGATVHLMTENGSLSQIVATATTDARGRYEFRGAPVPLRGPGEAKDATARVLQVCGTAPGLAFAWKPRFTVAVPGHEPRAGNIRSTAEPHRVDLVFGRPEAFTGRVVDEQEQPVVGVKVRLRFGEWLRRLWDSGDTSFWTLDGALPPSLTTATTGPDGRFRLGGVPHNFLARLAVTHPNYADLDLYAATADPPLPVNLRHFMSHPDAGLQNPVWTGEITLTLVPPRSVPVRVVSDQTGAPLAGIRVGLWNRSKVRVESWGQTDAAGRTVLRMPPGEYTLYALAPLEAGFIVLRDTVSVTAAPAEQPRTVRLVPGCVLEITAVDADTGFPVRGVRFEQEADPKPGMWKPLESQTGYMGGAETEKWGKLRVVVAPGQRRIMAAHPYVTVKGPTGPVELPAGKEVKLRFELRE
jgi:protocatechuate 3,4-dioxygenase beta subunit